MSRASVRVIGALWVLLTTSALAAQTAYVSNGTGNWSTSTVWLPQGVPGAGDTVTIRNNDEITVTGSHTVDNITLDSSTGIHKLKVSGSLTISGTGTALDLQAPASFGFSLVGMFGGSITIPNGDVAIHGETSTFGQLDFASGGATVDIGGNLDFTGSNPSIARLTFNDAGGGSLSIGGNLDSGGGITATYGTLFFDGTGAQTIGGPYTLHDASILKVSGTATLGAALTLTGDLANTVGTLDLNNFPLTVGGTLTNSGFFSGNNSTLTLLGDLTNSSTLFLLGGTLKLNGSAPQTLDTPPFALNVGTLELNNLAGATLNGLGSANGAVILNGGNFTVTGGGFFLITASATVTRTSGWFVGKLRMDFTPSIPRTMHVGTPGSYMPIDVDPGTGGTVEALAFDTTSPYRTGVSTLDRYWSITGLSSVASLNSLTFHYNQTDFTTGSENRFVLGQYNGGWTRFGDVDDAANSGSTTNISSYVGDWTIGETGSLGGASQLAISDVNGGAGVYAGVPFNVTAESRADDMSPAGVTLSTTVDVLLQTGTGSLLTASGTIAAGDTSTVISGLTYDTAESIQLRAESASGDTLVSGVGVVNVLTLPSTLSVTTLADSGPGSLRDVLTTLNAGGCTTPCTVGFTVSGTIPVQSDLPAITFSDVTIDGYTAPGASPNTNAFGQPSNAVITVALDGAPGSAVTGLEIQETFVRIRGLAIQNFRDTGVGVGVKFSGDNSGSKVAGCNIGTTMNGLAAAPNDFGVVFAASFESSAGGTTPADRNLISGNAHTAISVSDDGGGFEVTKPRGPHSDGISPSTGSNTIFIAGNYIGTKADLSGALANDYGIFVCNGCSSVNIGGSGTGNVISGNTFSAIRLEGDGVVVAGNLIGPAGNSSTALPNALGIEITSVSANNTIGGISPADANVISGNSNGLSIEGDDTTVDNNTIGLAPDGSTAMGNSFHSIILGAGADRNRIGTSIGNIIANHTIDGVYLHAGAGIGNTIQRNSIGGSGLPIDIGGDGLANANDPTDADTGPNDRQNHPVLNNAILGGGNVGVKLSLDSSAGVNVGFVVFDLYRGNGSNPSQAPLYLGNSGCLAGNVFSNILVSVPAGPVTLGDKVLATATAYSDAGCTTPSEGTSETSPTVTVTTVGGTAADLDVSSFSPAAPVAQLTPFTFQFFILNNGPDPATNVAFTAPIPGTLTFNSVTAPCTYAAGTVNCTFSSIAPANNASLTISLTTGNVPGTHTVTGSAFATETDPDTSNNSIPTSVGVTGNAMTVVNTNNSGTGSLRQALLDAQNGLCVSPCAIGFNIPAPPYVIQPPVDLPPLGNGISLDATTQPGYSGTPVVEIDLSANINSVSTLTLNGIGSTIRGFALTNGNNGITVNGDSNTVEANFIGLTPAGIAEPNDNGIVVTGNNNTIGGTAPNARNVISGNFAVGARFETDATGNSIAGNYIGTDPTGSTARPNGTGIEVLDTATQTTIGGASAAHRNVISGNVTYGIRLEGEGVSVGIARRRIVTHSANAVNDTLIANNWIGPNAAGSSALGAATAGILIESDVSGTVIGVPAQGNYISGNGTGITVSGSNVAGTKIAANTIGVAPDGITPMGNTLSGIVVNASYVTIGGPGNGNVIANNGDEGIEVLSGATNHISQNSIFNNAFLGIDLNDDGVTANDAGDADGGANGLQNTPNVTSATLNGGNLTVAYNLDSSATGAGSIGFEIFKADSAASGEGKSYLGFACIAGNAFGVGTTFPAAVALGDPIVLTATNYSDGACTTVADGTSEFSAPVLVTGCAPPPATITPSGPTSFCTGGSVTLTASAGASYFWSTGATTQAITVNTSGSYSVTVTDGAGCPATSAPTTVTVTPPPLVNITGPLNACDSAILDAGSGFSSYLWSTGATTQTITVTSSNTYSVTVTNAGGCSASDSHSITINPTPVATITAGGPTTFCTGGSVTLTANPAGASYSWSNGATTQAITVTTGGSYSVTVTGGGGCFNTSAPTLVTVNPAPIVNITGPINACDSAILDAGPGFSSYLWSTGATTQTITVTSSNIYSVTVTNAGGCTGSDTHTISVNPTPAATITPSGPTTFCTGGSVTLTANPAGASYSWSNGATTQAITVSTGGAYSVTVTGAGGCFNTSAPTNVTVNPAPIVNITGPINACDTAVLDAGPGFSSYLWSTGATTQTITVTSSNTYSVTVTNAGGCTGSDTHTITVNPTPVATITPGGPTTFCTGGTVTLTASPAGASYSWSNGATTQAITVSTGGSYSVTVTGAGGCFNTSAPTLVTVNPAPIVNITGPINACDSAILDAGPGFSSYLWSTGATTQTITVTSSNTYSVTVTNASGCTGSDTHTISVNPTPVATITPGGPTTFCTGGSVTLTATPAGASYSWSNGATTQAITVSTGGSYSVTVTGAGGCFNTSAPTLVTVNPAPIVNITGPLNACDSAILDAGPGFSTYAWSTGATTQTITVTSSNTYSVTVSNGSCTASDSHNITVNPTPAATITPSGPTTFCTGGSVTLTANPAGASYSWSNGATTQAIAVNTGGSYSVTVSGAGGCFNTSAPTLVTVNPAPIVTITGPASACDSALLDAGPGFSSYLWSTGETTQSITVTASNTYSVTVSNGSCTATDSHGIIVNPTPAATITPSGPTTFCAGGSVTLTATPAGASYLWSNGATTQAITVTASGAFTVTVTGAGGCSNTSAGTVVTVNPAPAVTITGPNSACASAVLDAGPGFASYLWSTGQTTQSIAVFSTNTYSVTVTNAGGCSASDSHSVIINSAGAANITGPASMCPGQSVVLDAGPGYTGYLWSTGATTQSITVSPAGTTIYSVTVTDGSGCNGSDTHTLTVNPAATASITPSGPTTFCAGGSVTLTANASAFYLWSTGATTQAITVNAAGSYSVTITDAGGCSATSPATTVTVNPAAAVTITGPTATCAAAPVVLDAGAGFATYSWSTGQTSQTITVSPASTATYSVTVTNGSGCTGTDSHTVTVTSNPTAAITAPPSVCSGANASASVAPIAGATYAWSIANGTFTSPANAAGVTFTAGTSGSVTLNVTVTSGTCTSSGSQPVPITAPPVVAIIGPTQACPNTTFTLSAGSGFAAYAWSTGATTPSVNLQQGAATQTYSVTVTDASGCSATDSHTVTLGTAASASITAPSSAAANATGLTASVTAQPGAVYAWNITNGTITAGLGTNAVTFTAGGSGTTKLTITVTLGSCSASGQRSVTINGAPVTGADLSIIKTAPSTIAVGGSLTYTITVANAGPQSASNITVTDPLPDGAALVSVDSPSLVCNRFSNVILCNGALGINASKTLTLTVTAPMQSGFITNTATVNSEVNDPATSNNSASATTNVLSSSDPCAGRTTVTPLAPANNTTLASSLVDFQWTAAGGAAGYRLWLRLDDGPAASTEVDETSLQLTIEQGAGEWWIETLYEGCPSTESQHLRFTVPQRDNCTTATPEALAPSNGISVAGADVTFTWTGVPGALGYGVWLSAGGSTPTLLGTTNATSLTHLVPAGAMEWFVRAIVDRCPSRDSQRARFTFAPPTACLDNLVAHALTPLSDAKIARAVDFAWTAPPRATSYELFIVRGRGTPQLVATTPNAFARGIPLATGKLRWFVRTHFSGGCPPLDSAEQKLEIVTPPPACATLHAPSISALGQISAGVPFTIQWDDVPGATNYELQLATASTFSDAQTVSTSGTEHALTRTNDGADAGAVYARVRALDTRCQPATTTPYGPVAAIFILPLGTEGAAPLTGGPVSLRIVLGSELAGQTFTVSIKEPWLSVVPTSGVVAAGGTTLAVTAETTGLPLGTSLGAVRITLNTPAAANRVQANATTVKLPTMGISKVTPVTPAPKSAPPPDALIIPAVAHADGINAKFQSDVRVTNSSAQSLQYQVTFTATGGAGSANGRQTTFSIDPGRTIALDDVLRSWFGTGGESVTGTLEVRPLTQTASSTANLPFSGLPDLVTFAASRTFNVTANGTFGQYIPAIPFANFIGQSSAQTNAILSLQQIAQSDRYRTNLGIVEGSGEAASLLVKVFGSNGAKLTEFPVNLAGGEHTQLNSFLTTQGVGPLSDGRVEISVISGNGKVTAYASVLDNATSDPLLVTPVALNGAGSTKWVVPGVADLDNGTANWQTDMRLFNAGTTDVEAALTFYSLNGGTPKTATVTLPAGQVRQFDRTLATVFGASNDGGAVHITTATNTRLVATARTYNQTSTGTYGQFISGITPAEAAGLGSRPLQILQVEETDRFRSNIGLAEVTGNPVKLEISIVPPDAKFTAVTEVQLHANEFRQINSLLRSAGLAETYNARVTVRVIEGTGRVTAYASVIDMLTNDPTYVPAQ
jgi:uncharacterized repeat protein (TIGR01451 family)